MWKALLLIFILIMLVRTLSKLFLQKSGGKKSNFRFFYQTFKNVREQQKKKQQQDNAKNGRVDESLDDIEEADYEDITDDTADSSK